MDKPCRPRTWRGSSRRPWSWTRPGWTGNRPSSPPADYTERDSNDNQLDNHREPQTNYYRGQFLDAKLSPFLYSLNSLLTDSLSHPGSVRPARSSAWKELTRLRNDCCYIFLAREKGLNNIKLIVRNELKLTSGLVGWVKLSLRVIPLSLAFVENCTSSTGRMLPELLSSLYRGMGERDTTPPPPSTRQHHTLCFKRKETSKESFVRMSNSLITVPIAPSSTWFEDI